MSKCISSTVHSTLTNDWQTLHISNLWETLHFPDVFLMETAHFYFQAAGNREAEYFIDMDSAHLAFIVWPPLCLSFWHISQIFCLNGLICIFSWELQAAAAAAAGFEALSPGRESEIFWSSQCKVADCVYIIEYWCCASAKHCNRNPINR